MWIDALVILKNWVVIGEKSFTATGRIEKKKPAELVGVWRKEYRSQNISPVCFRDAQIQELLDIHSALYHQSAATIV